MQVQVGSVQIQFGFSCLQVSCGCCIGEVQLKIARASSVIMIRVTQLHIGETSKANPSCDHPLRAQVNKPKDQISMRAYAFEQCRMLVLLHAF